MNMRKEFKYTLLCSALLMTLSSIPVSSINANHRNNVPHKHVAKIIKNSAHHQRISLSKLGQIDAKHDLNRFNEDEEYGYLFAHPNYIHNPTFRRVYLKSLTKLAPKYDYDSSVDSNINDIKLFKHYLPMFLELRGNYKAGFLSANRHNGIIPKGNRHNVAFARGYLLGEMYMDNVNNTGSDDQRASYRKAPVLVDIQGYYGQGNGEAPATLLVTRRKGNIYNQMVNLENQSNKYAWTCKQMQFHTKKLLHSLHLNKSLTRQFKDILNPWYVDDYGNDLASTKFASSINKLYPYHHSMYYPKDMDGGKSTGQYEGETIYMHNNKATKKTNQAFRKYMRDYMIYHAGKDCDDTPKNSKSLLKYMKNFTKNYTNKNYKGQNNTPYAQWRLITHKHHPYSSILYLTPQDGWNYYMVKN